MLRDRTTKGSYAFGKNGASQKHQGQKVGWWANWLNTSCGASVFVGLICTGALYQDEGVVEFESFDTRCTHTQTAGKDGCES